MNRMFIFDCSEDADAFLSQYNHDNNYTYNGYTLQVRDIIRINDGIYNVDWLIAGFDCEKSRVASDGTLYDNGYGIALVPEISIGIDARWNNINTLSGAYYSSDIRNITLHKIAIKLQSILGTHLVERNVLLSSSVDSDYRSNGYKWTKDYCTLMSNMQLGALVSYGNQYDLGEANYTLPLFDDPSSRKTGSHFWTRSVWGKKGIRYYYAWNIHPNGGFYNYGVYDNLSVRPLIYIR